jgi:hypothetical protein
LGGLENMRKDVLIAMLAIVLFGAVTVSAAKI